MQKLDITASDLTVSEYINSFRGFIPKRFIPYAKPRPSNVFVFVLSGSCKYTFDDGTTFEAKKDGILYLSKGSIYEMDITCDKYEFFGVNFNFLTEAPRKSAFYLPLSPQNAEKLFSRLCYNNINGAAFAQNMALLYQIIALINESKERTYIGSEARAKIEKSAETIHLNFADSTLSVAKLAENAGFSEVYFRKLFALRFGQPPSRYIMHTRITNALKLMPLEEFSLERIAEESGFASLPYFTKVFKMFMGEPPAAYRRSLSKQNNMT